MLRSRRVALFALPFAAIWLVSACSDNGREPILSQVDTIDIPVADVGNQQNTNIANPTLNIPATFEVAPGDVPVLVWSEEFDGPDIDPETWFFATGDGTEKGLPGGWGNEELQYYLPDNAQIVNGVLQITARRETAGGLNYTSARINTEDRFAFRYGRVEASIKLPSGQGLWPAFWMLSQDSDYLCTAFPSQNDGRDECVWAAIGEIDIVEAVNLDALPNPAGLGGGNEIFGTIHYGGEFPYEQRSETTYVPSEDVTEGFHTYALEWDADEIRWYFDDTLYAVQNSWFSTADNGGPGAPFNQPFHILLNLAVGGRFPGDPDATTPFPATMEVDWVRVYSGEAPPVEPPAPDPVVFDDDFGAGVSFVPFGGSVNDLAVDTNEMFSGAASLRVAVPSEGYTGGALAVDPGRDVSGYDTLTFWAKADGDHTLNVAGIGNDGVDTTNQTEVMALALTTEWQQFTITIPDPSVLTANTGLFHFAEGSDEGAYTIWFDDITYEVSGGGGVPGGDGNFVNGDFETGGLTGWTLTQVPDGVGSITADSSMQGGRAGTVARLMAAGSATPFQTNDVLISQEGLGAGTVSPGDTIDVSFDLYGSLAGGGGVVFVEVIFLDAAGQDVGGRDFVSDASLPVPEAPYTPTDTWTTYSGTVVAGTAFGGGQFDVSGGVVLSLKVACGPVDNCAVDASFDNVTFTIN